jgi:hypothetical protein
LWNSIYSLLWSRTLLYFQQNLFGHARMLPVPNLFLLCCSLCLGSPFLALCPKLALTFSSIFTSSFLSQGDVLWLHSILLLFFNQSPRPKYQLTHLFLQSDSEYSEVWGSHPPPSSQSTCGPTWNLINTQKICHEVCLYASSLTFFVQTTTELNWLKLNCCHLQLF